MGMKHVHTTNGKPVLTFHGRLELEVHNKRGQLVARHVQDMRSFTANFVYLLANILATEPLTWTCSEQYGANTIYFNKCMKYNVTAIDSTSKPVKVGAGQPAPDPLIAVITSPAGDATYGILVGSGTTPPSISDYKLENPYTEGSNLGQLSHGKTTVENPVISGNTAVLRIVRTFTNNYTDAQSVTETGIVARNVVWNYDMKYLIARDVLTQPVSIPSGSTLTVRYVLTITV